MSAMGWRIHLDALTVSGRSVGDNIAGKEPTDTRVIASIERPIKPENALCILRGKLAPSGLSSSRRRPVLRSSAMWAARSCSSALRISMRIDQADLDVDASSVLGSRGYPGMPELGNIRIPAKLLERRN
jgi:dihydroxy-acid dehydratase